jgi:hypothetical protein
MTNMRNRPEDFDYRRQNRWQDAGFDRGRGDFERDREEYDWNYNQGGAGMGRGRRIWDQESGMYNQSPGYGRSTQAGWRGSEFGGGGSSYGGWGRGGYGEYDRGDFERGAFNRGRRYDEGTYYGGGNRFNEGQYGGRGRFNEGMDGGRDQLRGDAYAQRGYGDEGWFRDDTAERYGGTDEDMTGGYDQMNRGEFGGAYRRMSESFRQGPHTGRGPRGYRRSDDRIREDVSEELAQHGWIDASDVEVEVKDGEVTLKGTVDDRSQKRMAEDVAERITGVKDVHNELRIRSHTGGEPEREHRATVETGHATGNTHVTVPQR